MGRIYEALQRSSAKSEGPESVVAEFAPVADTPKGTGPETMDFETDIELDRARPLTVAATPERRLIALAGERSLGAEKIRLLAARLRHLQSERALKKLLVTSSVKDEGKTLLSTNVAVSLAKTGQQVLLIDGDCHQANAARLLGANGSPGLTNWWRSAGTMQSYLLRINKLPLWFVPAGDTIEQPLEILQSARLADEINRMAVWFDWVIIDSPPCAPLADAGVWATVVDGILLVAREGKTPKRLLRKVMDSLDSKKLLGIVLNDCTDPDQHYYTHYYNLHHTQGTELPARFSAQNDSKD
jgi:capsular exopolysaccharide synthesis family protein